MRPNQQERKCHHEAQIKKAGKYDAENRIRRDKNRAKASGQETGDAIEGENSEQLTYASSPAATAIGELPACKRLPLQVQEGSVEHLSFANVAASSIENFHYSGVEFPGAGGYAETSSSG